MTSYFIFLISDVEIELEIVEVEEVIEIEKLKSPLPVFKLSYYIPRNPDRDKMKYKISPNFS